MRAAFRPQTTDRPQPLQSGLLPRARHKNCDEACDELLGCCDGTRPNGHHPRDPWDFDPTVILATLGAPTQWSPSRPLVFQSNGHALNLSSQSPMVDWHPAKSCDDTDLVTNLATEAQERQSPHLAGFAKSLSGLNIPWLRGQDLNLRPLGYEPNELPDCSTPRLKLAL